MQREGHAMGVAPRAVRNITLAVLAVFSLAACATVKPQAPIRSASTAGAPRGTMKPYQVRGVWYTPREQPNYNEVGMASWYGGQHQGRQTASGEVFDMRTLTGAHKTLPLPSIVEVKNLENGRTVRLRVNDRGPFSEGRIIDVSRAAAEELGFIGQGQAKVRVRYVGPAGPSGRDVGYRTASAPEPARSAPSSRSGPWRVQAGSFSERDNAERLVEQLAGAGDARIEKVERDGERFYRVVLGSFAEERDAQALLERVAAIAPGARVMRPS
jgi:rare lipoprotein A